MAGELGSAGPVRKIAGTWLRELPQRLDGLDVAARHGDAPGAELVDALREAGEAAAARVRDWIHLLPPDAAS